MATAPDLSKLVPGFDFLQGLVKNAGTAMPSVGQWIAPTLDPEELAKRIDELKTVQFWLEQNARMLSATIQAMEVQRMTLSTLKTMNVQMGDLRDAMKMRMQGLPGGTGSLFATPAAEPKASPAAATSRAAPSAAPTPAPSVLSAFAPAPAPATPSAADAAAQPPEPATGDAPPPGLVDPMKWWNALTQQFTELATAAVKDGAGAVSANVERTMAAAARPAEAGPAATSARDAGASPAKTSARTAPAGKAAAKKSAARKPATPTAARKRGAST